MVLERPKYSNFHGWKKNKIKTTKEFEVFFYFILFFFRKKREEGAGEEGGKTKEKLSFSSNSSLKSLKFSYVLWKATNLSFAIFPREADPNPPAAVEKVFPSFIKWPQQGPA